MTEEDFKGLAERHGLVPSRTLREYVDDIIRTETTLHTHSMGCWSWGPRHYLCALNEIRRITNELEELRGQTARQEPNEVPTVQRVGEGGGDPQSP